MTQGPIASGPTPRSSGRVPWRPRSSRGLATLAAVVYPFSTGAPLDQKAATAVVDPVLGIAITSLLTGVAARAVRRRAPTRSPAGSRYAAGTVYDTEQVPAPRP